MNSTDINTLAEESQERAFTAPQIAEFFGAAVQDADKILSLYFPKGINNAGH
jgi:hypothetical protein